MQWIDVTVPIRSGMMVFEGDSPVSVERVSHLAKGDVSNLSKIEFGLHTGTHIDAPVHFIEGGGGIETVPPGALVGPALVVDATMFHTHLTAEDVVALNIPLETERVLFKTRNGPLWEQETFSRDFIALTVEAANELVGRGIRLVGVDYLSVAPFGDPAPTHRALLEAGVVIVEGLDLRPAEPDEYQLVCLPLLIPGSDGGPTRALLGWE